MWQRAYLVVPSCLPGGAEVWVRGEPVAMPALVRGATPAPETVDPWRAPGDAGEVVETHLRVASGKPVYVRRSALELSGESRAVLEPVALSTCADVRWHVLRSGRTASGNALWGVFAVGG